MFISTSTSRDEAERAATVAVLPVGSFEQHGSHLPLSTDTLIACAIARRVAADYNLLLLPPVSLGCSHEHAGFAGSVSISSATLAAVVTDVAGSLRTAGVQKLVVVNGHGGNYVLSNVVQEANVEDRRMALFPRSEDWRDARQAAGMVSDNHQDMHGGEAETSILLAESPEVVRPNYRDEDNEADDRRFILTVGMSGYTESGIIGRPSLATAEKGTKLLDAFSTLFSEHLTVLLADG
ncbi:creatininase family protein [Pseudonocardia hydrocarbonoxydans]|uniref:Creatinine amidohydrolase n=1 Tax=Pseudonocardia hydrocarbonoxydans TaxID=76726 RepID=A0A4Y3WX20_9PSEU|nr:creatininase family protein [Pseudonocardia hydrocarbonoxydans]GEC22670.1 creatinine amidohydrolase [Pseudonocardia hydrocarbonoxydans]